MREGRGAPTQGTPPSLPRGLLGPEGLLVRRGGEETWGTGTYPLNIVLLQKIVVVETVFRNRRHRMLTGLLIASIFFFFPSKKTVLCLWRVIYVPLRSYLIFLFFFLPFGKTLMILCKTDLKYHWKRLLVKMSIFLYFLQYLLMNYLVLQFHSMPCVVRRGGGDGEGGLTVLSGYRGPHVIVRTWVRWMAQLCGLSPIQ